MSKNKSIFNKFITLICVFCLFSSFAPYSYFFSQELFADQNSQEYNAAFANGGLFYASKPQCGGLTEATALLAVVKPIFKMAMAGAKNLKKKNYKTGSIQLGIAVVGTTAFVASASNAWQCYFSFVRDPVAFSDNSNPSSSNPIFVQEDDVEEGPKKDASGKIITTANRYEALRVPYSDYLTVCARSPLPYITDAISRTPILNYLIGAIASVGSYSATDFTRKAFSCYGQDVDPDDEENLYFDGKNSFLCPEEWRVHNYKYELIMDSKTESIAKKAIVSDEKMVRLSDFLVMKQNNGPLQCKTGAVGQTLKLHNYNYKIVKMGGKICARLIGLDVMVTSLALQSYIVGCHYKKPDDLAPMCAKSNPIYVKDPITGEDVVIDYDNSECFSCYVSDSCYRQSALHAKSIFPVTSHIAECMQSSLSSVLFGCQKNNNSSGGVQTQIGPGMLTIAHQNLSKISMILISLAIAIFAIRITLAGHIPQVGEVVMFAMKIGIVLFFTYGSLGSKGMLWTYSNILNLSSGLSKMMLDTLANQNGVCKFNDQDYSVISNQNIFYQKNYSFLKPFDILDCNMFFYLGGSLLGYKDAEASSWEGLVNIMPKIIALSSTVLLVIFTILDPAGILLLFFSIFILTLIISIVSLIMISMLFLALLVLISPLIIPSLLFNYSKSFFDGWLKEIFAYTMISPFLYLFLVLMISTFNKPILGETQFKRIEKDIHGRNVIHFGYEKLDCNGGDKSKNLCKNCLDKVSDSSICDGCDIEALACKTRFTKLHFKNVFFGILAVNAENRGDFALNMLSNAGYLLIMSLLYLTIMRALIMVIARALGGSRTMYALAREGSDPLSQFSKGASFLIKPAKFNDKKGLSFLKNKWNNRSKKNNDSKNDESGSSGSASVGFD